MTGRPDLRTVGLAAGVAVASSVGWYAAFGPQLARYDVAYADNSPPPAWLLPVELARSVTVATAVAVLAERTRTHGVAGAARLGLGLWAAFPVVLLTGSVVHEKVPWQQAAIHGGDWLVTLLLMSGVVAGRRGGVAPRRRTLR